MTAKKLDRPGVRDGYDLWADTYDATEFLCDEIFMKSTVGRGSGYSFVPAGRKIFLKAISTPSTKVASSRLT